VDISAKCLPKKSQTPCAAAQNFKLALLLQISTIQEDVMEKQANQIEKKEKGGLGGYMIAWILGVPASLLVLIFLIRGH
jgi:hypothetical protein